jgi:hypothetical protein
LERWREGREGEGERVRERGREREGEGGRPAREEIGLEEE